MSERRGFFAYADQGKQRHRVRTSKVHAVDEQENPICGSGPIGEFHETFGAIGCARCRTKYPTTEADDGE